MIEVVEAGLLTTIQDLGRPGHAAIGVPPSGAVDPALATRCNRMVGNRDGDAVIETVGGLTIRAERAITVCTDLEASARSLPEGAELTVATGIRQWHYVAVRGGIDVEPVLGSRSSDTLSGLGPRPLVAGDRLPVGAEPTAPLVGEPVPVRPPPDRVRIVAGPRADWFDDAYAQLEASPWTIGESSRVGVRLAGRSIVRRRDGELPSEGLVRGALQVPPDGRPVMMLADHPTTGGYPVVAVVHPDDVAVVAQQPGGTTVRLVR